MRVLQVIDLHKAFTVHALGQEVRVLNGVHLELSEGEFCLVTGQNGSGKSTLLRCIYRTCLPTAGSILFHSRSGVVDLARAADEDVLWLRRYEMAHVTQFLRANPRASALEVVAESLIRSGIDRADALYTAREWLGALGLRRELWDMPPSTFSGGEQQKVNIARALARPVRLLLLDEPTASLDREARAALVQQLRRLKDQGVAIIGVFHQEEEVRGLVDQVVRLGEG